MSIDRIRQIKAKAKKKEPGKKKYIRHRTPKKAKEYRTLGKLYGPYLEEHPVCAIESPVCTYRSETVNHKAGRGEDEVLDQETWEPACSACNLWIEANDGWAQQRGHKISRHAKKSQ
jgi:hypothetical protein